ncbi:MAG: hypothetical protein M1455_05490 [Actinobacteria bacterium]|nr:hypothetical protein [Actinomycetota bacterium]
MDGVLKFIDTHCHIIPGVDDGAADIETSIEMGRIAAADGVTTIVATPHIVEGFYDGANREQKLQELRSGLLAAGISLDLVAGAEVPMSACLAGDEDFLRTLTIDGGNYLLMETAETTFEQVAQAAYRVRLCGLIPILAHPERTIFVQEHPLRLAEIIDRDDIFCQVTAGSIEGLFGKTIRRTSLAMAEAGMMHLVASDAHSTRRRSPRLTECYRLLVEEAGVELAQMVLVENPSRVLSGEKLERSRHGIASSRRSLRARIFRSR